MDVPQVDTVSKEPDVSMDDLVKQAIEKAKNQLPLIDKKKRKI